jgi:hypothetical protein
MSSSAARTLLRPTQDLSALRRVYRSKIAKKAAIFASESSRRHATPIPNDAVGRLMIFRPR